MPENDDLKIAIEKSSPTVSSKVERGSASLARRGLGLLKCRAENPPPALVAKKESKVGDTRTVTLPGGLEMVFCYIPAGEFLMGSPGDEEGRFDSESPVHRVVISKQFWMGKFQVTQAQWEAVMGSCPDEDGWGFPDPNNPAETISWDDCHEFLKNLNAFKDGNVYALPTEAQWEYACRAGTTNPFSFGATITPNQVNYAG